LRGRIECADTVRRFGLEGAHYAVVTLHRPSNVDAPAKLGELVSRLEDVAKQMPIVFAVHPRTRKRLQEFGLEERVAVNPRIRAADPLGYIEFMNLVK